MCGYSSCCNRSRRCKTRRPHHRQGRSKDPTANAASVAHAARAVAIGTHDRRGCALGSVVPKVLLVGFLAYGAFHASCCCCQLGRRAGATPRGRAARRATWLDDQQWRSLNFCTGEKPIPTTMRRRKARKTTVAPARSGCCDQIHRLPLTEQLHNTAAACLLQNLTHHICRC
jgi:hypothetical protein